MAAITAATIAGLEPRYNALEHSDVSKPINLKRMLSVLTSKCSLQMYDRHIAVFNRLHRYYRQMRQAGNIKRYSDEEEHFLFNFSGMDENETICQIIIEGFQRAVDGGGQPLIEALSGFLTMLCSVIGDRESFETEESAGIENLLATLTQLLGITPSAMEDNDDNSSVSIDSIIDSLSVCVFQSLLLWLIPKQETGEKYSETASRLVAPRLLRMSGPEFKPAENKKKLKPYPLHLKLIERSAIIQESVKFLARFHNNQDRRVFILQLLYHALPSTKVLMQLTQERGASELLRVISDGYKAEKADNYSAFTDFERSIALEVVWALLNGKDTEQNVLSELREMRNLMFLRQILAPLDTEKESHRPLDKQIRNDAALVLLRLVCSIRVDAPRSNYQSQQLFLSKNINSSRSHTLYSRPSSSSGQTNRPKSVSFAPDKTECLAVARAVSDNVSSAGDPTSDMFIQSGLVEMLVARLRTDQRLSDSVKDHLHPNTKHDEDYFFTRILLQITAQFCRNTAALNHMLSKGLLPLCFEHFKTAAKEKDCSFRWTQHQRLAVRQEILGLLQVILYQAPEMFLDIEGPLALCRFVQASFEQRVTVPGDSVPEVEHVALIGSVLKFLLFIVEKIPDHQIPLVNLGVMDLCLDVLRKKGSHFDLVCTAFLICCSFCRENRANRRLFGKADGVQTIISYLGKISPDGEETERMRLVCFEAIWSCIIGNSANETLFMQLDGVYKILDILVNEKSKKVQRHLLGAFLDLLENPKARSHALEWRYNEAISEKKSVVNLLVQMWKNEEKDIACEDQSQTGFIRVSVFPLRGNKQNAAHPKDTVKNSQAVAELYENLRAKIFATLSKLGFENLDNYLSVEEQIRFKKIQKYLDFKIGEVWEEIKNELEYEGIRPTSPDEECLRTSRQMTVKKADNVHSKQNEIARKKQDKEREEERHFYAEFIDSHTTHSYQKHKEPSVARVQTVSRKSLEHA